MNGQEEVKECAKAIWISIHDVALSALCCLHVFFVPGSVPDRTKADQRITQAFSHLGGIGCPNALFGITYYALTDPAGRFNFSGNSNGNGHELSAVRKFSADVWSLLEITDEIYGFTESIRPARTIGCPTMSISFVLFVSPMFSCIHRWVRIRFYPWQTYSRAGRLSLATFFVSRIRVNL